MPANIMAAVYHAKKAKIYETNFKVIHIEIALKGF